MKTIMHYTLRNGKSIELTPEDCGGITWMCMEKTFRDMTDGFLSCFSSNPDLYTEEAKDELAERMTNFYFCDEDLDDMKVRHAKETIEEMDEELTNSC